MPERAAQDSFPYLVTPLRPGGEHRTPLPPEAPEDVLVAMARAHAQRYGVPTRLVLSPDRALDIAPEGSEQRFGASSHGEASAPGLGPLERPANPCDDGREAVSLKALLTQHLRQFMELGIRGDPEAVLALALGLAVTKGPISEERAWQELTTDPTLIEDAFRASGWRPAPEALCGDQVDAERYVGPVVYGAVPGGDCIGDECLVFLPRDRACYLAAMHDVLQTATTWGECRSRLTPAAYQDLLEAAGATERPDFDAFYRRQRRRAHRQGRRLTRRAAWRAYMALDPDERQPLPRDPFVASRIGAYMDGDWPGWPKHEMVFWVPTAIQKRFGRFLMSVFNGEYLEFAPEDEAQVVEALIQLGYPCVRDDALVRKASGY